jgi:hypothetical protein
MSPSEGSPETPPKEFRESGNDVDKEGGCFAAVGTLSGPIPRKLSNS